MTWRWLDIVTPAQAYPREGVGPRRVGACKMTLTGPADWANWVLPGLSPLAIVHFAAGKAVMLSVWR